MSNTTTGHFHIGHNMPGYLPESETYCTDTAEWAMEYFHGEAHRAADDMEGDEDFLNADTEQALITVADLVGNGGVSIHIGNSVYWAEAVGGAYADCEARGDDI